MNSNFHMGKGYLGNIMSNNAVEAYDEGRMPLSKWKKSIIIDKIEENKSLIKCDYELLKGQPLGVLKNLLLSSDGEYHHMGMRYTVVDFYHFSTDRLSKLTDADIRLEYNRYATEKKQKEIKKGQDLIKNAQYDGRWEISYIKRSADGRYKREFILKGEIKGGWFYPDPESELVGEKKLSISGKNFNRIRRIE